MFNMDPAHQLVSYLVRHGELTDMGVWDAWSDLGLSEEGKTQANAAARWLSFERLGRAICSDVPRTAQTAQYLMETGAVVCPYLSCDPNLRPWMVGDFTGKEKTVERRADFQKYIDNPALPVPGGESLDQFHQRIQVIFQYIGTPYDGKPTVLFVHNSVLKTLMGLETMKEAVSPGGVVGAYMDESGELSFEVLLGEISSEKGVS